MTRVFDHMDGEPEDERFSAVAREMHASAFWSSIPERDEPAAIAGEIVSRGALPTGDHADARVVCSGCGRAVNVTLSGACSRCWLPGKPAARLPPSPPAQRRRR